MNKSLLRVGRRVSGQKVADSRFGSSTRGCVAVTLRKTLRLFPIGAKSLLVVVALPDKRLANRPQKKGAMC